MAPGEDETLCSILLFEVRLLFSFLLLLHSSHHHPSVELKGRTCREPGREDLKLEDLMDGPGDAEGGQADENVLLDPAPHLDGEAPDTLAPNVPSPDTDGMTDGHNKPQRATLFLHLSLLFA